MAVDAVLGEPFSAITPDNRENTGNLLDFGLIISKSKWGYSLCIEDIYCTLALG